MPSHHILPRMMSLTVHCLTPKDLARAVCVMPADEYKSRTSLTCSIVNFFARSGRDAAEPRTLRFGRWGLLGLGSPLTSLETYPKDACTFSDISLMVSGVDSARASISVFADANFDTLPSGLFLRPARVEWRRFSDLVTHSKFSKRLFAGSKSLWFTSVLSLGESPRNALTTNLWTNTYFLEPSRYRHKHLYPFLSVLSALNAPVRCTVYPSDLSTILSNDLTRPRSLTSYSPSYPTTGSHFSFSILNLFPGLLPSLRLIRNRLRVAFSGTPLVLVGSVQRLRRLVAWPESGAFPVLGQVCRS